MVLKCIFIVILFFKHNYLDIAKPNHDIKIDFDIQLGVPNHNHNVSSKMSHHKSNSSVNLKKFLETELVLGTKYTRQNLEA